MKKHLLSLFALASMVFASSCTSEEIVSQSTDNEVKVTFTTELRNDVKSRTVGEDTDNIDQLIFAVYDEMGNELPKLRQSTDDVIVLTSNGDKKEAKIEVTLVKGQTYSFAFWAQKKDFSAYTFDPTTADVTVNYAGRTANQREADAFFKGITNHKVTGTFTMDVTLKRPFAQVNFLTSKDDIVNAVKAGFNPDQSAIIVKNVAKTLNVLTGEVSNFENTEVEFNFADLLFDNNNDIESTTINGVTGSWKYLATAYFLPQDKSEETKINATMEIKAKDGNKATTEIVAPDITAQRNYRTNIYGNLLTSTGTFNVVVDPYFEDEDHHVASGVYDVTSTDLSTLLAKNKDLEGDLVYNVSGLSGADNVSVEIPEGTEASSLTLNFTDVKNSVNMSIADATSATTKYAGTVVIKTPADKTVPVLTIDLPDAHVYLPQGNYTRIVASTSSSTLVIGGGVTVGTLVVDKGHVRVEEGGDITTIERGKDNPDPVTYVAFESEEDIPEVANEDSEISYVSSTEFDLTAAITEGGEVKLTMDVELKEPLVIAYGIETIIDLNGFTISQKKEQTAGYEMILNDGNLTIQDSKGGGKISYTDTGKGGEYVSNTITNRGTLTIKSGSIENNSSVAMANVGYAYAIDTSIWGEATETIVNIEGGEIKSTYSPLRVKADSQTEKVEANISGGTFYGRIDHQMSSSKAGVIGILNISGGTFKQFGIKETSLQIFGAGLETDASRIVANITGGNFEGGIVVYRGEYVPLGKNFNGNFISGGTFAEDPSAFLADGYLAEEENGVYKIVEDEVAKIGSTTYPTLKKAIEAAKNGETIVLLKYITQKDGVIITDKNITIDLAGKTYTVTEGASTNNRNFKIDGSSVVTIKNGTMKADGDYTSGAYGTIRTEGTANVTLESVKLYNYRGNGLNVKALSGTTVTINNTEIYANYGGGVEAAGGNIELTNVKIEQKGMYTAPYNSMTISVNGGGQAIVHSGTYTTECITAEEANNQGSSHGPWTAGVLNSGGTLIIKGGTFSNDNFGDNSLATYARGLLLADTGANIQIEGGDFEALKSIIDIQNNLGDAAKNPSVTLAGGIFSAYPLTWDGLIKVANDYKVEESAGTWKIVEDPAAEINGIKYHTLQDAFNVGGEITLLRDVTLTETAFIESKTAVLDLNGKTITATASADRAIEARTDAELTVKNGNITAYGSTIGAIGGNVIIESGKYVQTGTAKSSPATNRYSIDCRYSGEITINDGEFESNNGLFNVGGAVVINDGKFTNVIEETITRHMFYTYSDLTIKGGEFYGKANASAGGAFFCGASKTCNIKVEGGKFQSLWTNGNANNIYENYSSTPGSIAVSGGMFNTNGGITSFVEENTDESTKEAYPYVAKAE